MLSEAENTAPWQDATDMRNAGRMLAEFGSVLRYCEPWRKWLYWMDNHWTTALGAVENCAQRTLDSMMADALAIDRNEHGSLRTRAIREALASEKGSRIREMLFCARSAREIQVQPEQLNANPMLLNCRNGTLDLRTCQLSSHDPANYITQLCPTPYEPDAQCQRWLDFLTEIFESNEELIEFVQRFIGYCLTGNVNEHVLLVAHGTGCNGKSTLVNVLLEMLGDDFAIKAPSTLLLRSAKDRHPTEIADLFGRRFAACVEADSGRSLAEAQMKELTGGDQVSARRMKEDFWRFTPTHKLLMAVNHRPEISGTDNGVWRRVKLLPFNVVITPDWIDQTLPDKLRAEYPGILAWAVRGCSEWQRVGLNPPAIVEAATGEYRLEQDVVARFIDECCVVGINESVRASELYSGYESWVKGEKPMSSTKFGAGIVEKGYERRKSGCKWYVGIRMKSAEESDDVQPADNGSEIPW